MRLVPVLLRRLALVGAMMLPLVAAPLRAQPVPLDSVRVDDPALVYAVTLANATTLVGASPWSAPTRCAWCRPP